MEVAPGAEGAGRGQVLHADAEEGQPERIHDRLNSLSIPRTEHTILCNYLCQMRMHYLNRLFKAFSTQMYIISFELSEAH